MVVAANFKNLTDYLNQFGQSREIPPLEQWNPEHCGEMDLIIKANGEWWHEGAPIRRQKMIDLFSKVLWKEGEAYFLKTPVEKIQIQVEDVPLLITHIDQVEIDGLSFLQLQTQNQDVFFVDHEHMIFLRQYQDEQGSAFRPYVHVRFGLEALIQRQAFYHLINYGELFEKNSETYLKFNSGDAEFTISMK